MKTCERATLKNVTLDAYRLATGVPLNFIAADNLRERQICAELKNKAVSDVLGQDLAQGPLRFLTEEFGVQMPDETEDMDRESPRLRVQAQRGITPTIERSHA